MPTHGIREIHPIGLHGEGLATCMRLLGGLEGIERYVFKI
jgi:hypothetical protein